MTKRIDLPLDWDEQREALGFDRGRSGRIESEREPLNLAIGKKRIQWPYLDAESAEVLADHNRPHIAHALKRTERVEEIMDYKWSLNYFLEKWLNHCLRLGYRFEHGSSQTPVAIEPAQDIP